MMILIPRLKNQKARFPDSAHEKTLKVPLFALKTNLRSEMMHHRFQEEIDAI